MKKLILLTVISLSIFSFRNTLEGLTPQGELFEAIKENNPEKLIMAIDNGADVNKPNVYSEHTACYEVIVKLNQQPTIGIEIKSLISALSAIIGIYSGNESYKIIKKVYPESHTVINNTLNLIPSGIGLLEKTHTLMNQASISNKELNDQKTSFNKFFEEGEDTGNKFIELVPKYKTIAINSGITLITAISAYKFAKSTICQYLEIRNLKMIINILKNTPNFILDSETREYIRINNPKLLLMFEN